MKTGNKSTAATEAQNARNTRKTLKVLQKTAVEKENILTGRLVRDKDEKPTPVPETKRVKVEDKGVQVGDKPITADDLTSEEPSLEYWKALAETRESQLENSFKINEQLNTTIEALQEENRACKEMLQESKHLVEVLQEMLGEGEEVAEEAQE